MTLPISVIILKHRDDARLRDCVASVGWASEVKAVENKIAISDFAQVRNDALHEIKHDWVFFVDSDEVVDEATPKLLEPLLNQPNISGMTVKRVDIFLGKELHWGEVGNVRLLRIMKKNSAHFERAVHEVAKVEGNTIDSGIILRHYAHQSVSEFLQKIIFYIQIEAQLRAKNGERFQLWQLLLYPPAKFFVNYFLKLGFLDGWRGLIYATMMSIHSAGVRATLYEKNHS